MRRVSRIVNECNSKCESKLGAVGRPKDSSLVKAEPVPTHVTLWNPFDYPYGYRGEMGPGHWWHLNDAWRICKDGTQQSPVDISNEHIRSDRSLNDLEYHYRYDQCTRISNNGVVASCRFTPKLHFIKGGPLQHEYELVQYHFHFSHNDVPGSEHALHGKRFPAEIHLVHFNTKYRSLPEAVNHDDGVTVVGAFLCGSSMSGVTSTALDVDMCKMKHVRRVGSTFFTDIDLPRYRMATKSYFTYHGSLTSPPCFECVQWIVLKAPIFVSHEALDSLAQLRSVEGGVMADPGNFRPLQPLNGRKIQSCCVPTTSRRD